MKRKTKKYLKQWLLDRIAEKSTWAGLLTILASFGLFMMDESVMMYYASFFSAVAGIIGVLYKEEAPKKRKRKTKAIPDKHDDEDIEIRVESSLEEEEE